MNVLDVISVVLLIVTAAIAYAMWRDWRSYDRMFTMSDGTKYVQDTNTEEDLQALNEPL